MEASDSFSRSIAAIFRIREEGKLADAQSGHRRLRQDS